MQCSAQPRFRARARKRGVASLVARARRADAGQIALLANALVRQFGGWEQLLGQLKPEQAGEFLSRFVTAHDELVMQSRAVEVRAHSSVADAARDPIMLSLAVQMLLALQPCELRPLLERLLLRARDRRACVMHGLGEGI